MSTQEASALQNLAEDNERFTKTASMLKLLSNPNRLMILYILSLAPRSVNEIHDILAQASNISHSSLSQHLALLRAHKIVSFKKTGQMSIYSISDERFLDLIRMLREINV
ncbi:MAG: metalloregulator ArsR/SmtB family transcription factor [Peptococcaceae bacterium]|nr:metalloregulator ArsR/SmtB family transcription factor [Peptococcaceae bacterium]